MYKVLILILLMAVSAQPAEILIRAKAHYLETADTTGWTQEQLDIKHQVTTKGSPIVIKPDGWNWGSAECPPSFILLKLPGIQISQILKYREGLIDSTQMIFIYHEDGSIDTTYGLLKKRRFKVPAILVDSVLNYYDGIITMTPQKLKKVIKEYKQGWGWE